MYLLNINIQTYRSDILLVVFMYSELILLRKPSRNNAYLQDRTTVAVHLGTEVTLRHGLVRFKELRQRVNDVQ